MRQLKSGTIYGYTEILAKRRDMVPYNTEQATSRIAAIKTMLANRVPTPGEIDSSTQEAAAVKAAAMELTGLEAKLEAGEAAEEKAIADEQDISQARLLTTEEATEKLKQDTLEADPKYQKAIALKSRNEVEQYMLLEFGQEIEISRPFKDLKDYAIEKTAKRILEG